MDIVNWVYLKKAELIKQNLSNSEDLLLLGADVSFDKRGDKYLSYAMTTNDFAEAIAGIIGAGSGTVSSIDVNGGTGISVSPAGPITTSGTFTVTNTAPDRIVVLNNGAGISVTGNYPNFTISATGGGGGTYTADNGITENPANNFQLGGEAYADSTFDTSRYIDTQVDALYIKGQPTTTLGPGGVITGVLNVTNDLGSGIATGINVNVDQPGQTSGYGINIKTGEAIGMKIVSSDSGCLDIDSAGGGLSKAVTINSVSTTAMEIGTQATSDSTPTIVALKYGTTTDEIQTIIHLIKSSNSAAGEPGIGAGIKFSVATDNAQVNNNVGVIGIAASDVTEGSVSSYYRLSLRDSGTEEHVLIVNGKGLFELPLGLSNYTNDAAAALGGIPVNGLYRNGSAVQIRVS
jgi:hypothetical protein